MTQTQSLALKVATVLWIVWGLVHAVAGVIVISSDATGGFQGIADAVDPELLMAAYHPAVGGILNQHGWNLLWGGLITMIGAVFIWRHSMTAIWVTAMIGGLLDIGYLVFVDIPGYVNFLPGTLMTVVSGTAVLLSFWVWIPVGRMIGRRNTSSVRE
ncbi:MAG: hypothetical protein AB8F65_14295 [Woeseiaceae bacterium]